MDVKVKKFDEMSADELYEILQLRSAVFVVEQACIYQDVDGIDRRSIHVCGYEDGKLAAYLRVFRNEEENCAQIGRVIAAKRGCGNGRTILKAGIKASYEYFSADRIILEAQVYAEGFYQKEGFKVISEPFDEDGIMHVKMERTVEK